jgi:hypothetical protein
MFQSLVGQCLACAIALTPTLQILHFLQVLIPHFRHWTANKRDQLHQVKEPPPLTDLIQEIIDEAKANQLKWPVHQVMDTKASGNSQTCSKGPHSSSNLNCTVCNTPYHTPEKYWCKNLHLWRKNWKPHQNIERSSKANSNFQKTFFLHLTNYQNADVYASLYPLFAHIFDQLVLPTLT